MPSEDLEKFVDRSFSFYPPILNIEHNEWTYEGASWSEVHIRNANSDLDLWVPRRYFGEISRVETPMMIVGLVQELEYEGGMLTPHRRRVLEMPGGRVPAASREGAAPPPPAPKRQGTGPERRIQRLILACLVVAVVVTFAGVLLTRDRQSGGRINYQTVLQAELGLKGGDSYFTVVRKLGEPAEERWRSTTGERQFQALSYPKLGVTVILMGPDRDQMTYIGAKDNEWRTVHSVDLPGGGSTDSILRALPKF